MKASAFALVAVLTLTACSFPTADPKAEALARTAFDQLRAADYAGLIGEVSKPDFGADPQPTFERMHRILPSGDPGPGKLVGFNSYAGTGGSSLTLTFQYDYPDAQVTTSVMLAKDPKRPQGWVIRGFHINLGDGPAPAPPAAPPKPKAKIYQT